MADSSRVVIHKIDEGHPYQPETVPKGREKHIAAIVHNTVDGTVWFVTIDGTKVPIDSEDHMLQICGILGKLAWTD